MATVKASVVVGRFVFFVFLIIQSFLLASYPASYEGKLGWYAISILFLPAAGFWWWISSNYETGRNHVLGFWTVYVWFGLVPMSGIVFGRTDYRMKSEGFLDPGMLKMTLSITPLLFLLMLHTGIASSEFYQNKLKEWSVKATINLFDGIDLLGVVLDENDWNHGIPRNFKNTLLAFACISFLWWPLILALDREACESHYNYRNFNHNKRGLYVISYGVQFVFDTLFLGLRLGLCLDYDVNASIFINKNLLVIIVYSWRILKVLALHSTTSQVREASVISTEAASPSSPTQPSAPPQPTVLDTHPNSPDVPVLAWGSSRSPPPPYSP